MASRPSFFRRTQRTTALALCALMATQSLAPAAVAQGASVDASVDASGAARAAAQGNSRNNLPALGDSASDDVSVSTERRIGDRILRDIRRDPDFLDDPLLLEYVQTMWLGLLSASRASGQIPPELDERFAWEIFLVRDRTVNAFALPGGYVGVHLGLMAITPTPDELASVLAHELAHVTQRHIARSVGASKTSTLVGLAGLILGVLAASRSPDAAQALIVGGQAVSAQGQLNYSREAEREADRVGFTVLTGAGYAAAGMPAMFEKLLVASRLNDSQNYPYLRSHPLTTERIGDARARLGVSGAVLPARPVVHVLMQARARVLMDARDSSLQRSQDFDGERALAAAATPVDRLAALYGSALASVLRRDHARADAALSAARPLAAGDAQAERALTLLGVQLALARNDGAKAGALLDTLAATPGADASRPVMLAQVQRALLVGAPQSLWRPAADRLQTWVAVHPNDSQAWSYLATLWEKLGQRLQAARATAESRYAQGDVQGAVERLRATKRDTRAVTGADFIEASVIESRLRELEVLRRQYLREDRGEL